MDRSIDGGTPFLLRLQSDPHPRGDCILKLDLGLQESRHFSANPFPMLVRLETRGQIAIRYEHNAGTGLKMPTYWQVAAGGAGREYSAEFLRYGLAFAGNPQRAAMEQVQPGDILLLKRGLSMVTAVGRAVVRDGQCVGYGGKHWLRDFDGWDLPSYCNVEWHVPTEPIQTSALTRATIQRVNQSHLVAVADAVLGSVPARTAIAADPPPTRPVADAEILEFLIREGMRPAQAEDLTSAFRRIRLLATYYYENCRWSDVREHETRTFLIMPLLLALGWAEQQVKIELGVSGGRVDVACFARPYRRDQRGQANDSDCILLLESKDFSSGLNYAPDQARGYAESFPSCQVVVVSNGYCYKTYLRTSEGFSASPAAYLNVLRPQDRYPLDPERVDGCLSVLRCLLPRSWG